MKPLHCLLLLTTLLLGSHPALGQRTATATANLAGQFVVSATVTDGGIGYVAPPVVTITGGGGSGAQATSVVAEGKVTGINIVQAGSGYTSAPTIVIDGPADFVKRGLVAYYPLDGNADDAVGENHGAIHGPTSTEDRFGKADSAFRFNGNGDYIQMLGPLPEMTSATASLWIAADDWAGIQMLLFEGDNNGGHDFALYLNGICTFVTKDDSGTSLHNYVPPLQTWTHLVTVADAEYGVVQLWVDGVLRASSPFGGEANIGYHSEFNLGHRGGGNNDWFYNGAMDEVRIYNRALSGPEVAALYGLQRGKPLSVGIAVKSYELSLTVTPGKGYQLQSSADLNQWVSVGAVFFPTTATVTQEVTATDHGRYWRLLEAP
ncbi:MAG TPA: LamG domain-containing protein [Candidatus Limnocylindria bacterium]|nr:LamG domain-containing protein [Candidatus Limnocylindria bacterium]